MGDYKDGWGTKNINHLNAEHYNVKLGYDLGDDSNLIFNYDKYKSDYSTPLSGRNSSIPVKGKKDNNSISLQYNTKINDILDNQFSIYRNKTTIKDNLTIVGYNNPLWDMAMKTTGISDQVTYKLNNQTITGGIDWYKDEITKYHNIYSDGHIDVPVSDGKNISNLAFYLQDKIDITDKWNITPGIRLDHNSKYGNHTSPSLSVGYKSNESTNYYVNYKTFFVAPNLYHLYSRLYMYGTTYLGNKDLKPTEGNTIEFGLNHKFNETLTGTFNIFHTKAKNRIKYEYTSADTQQYTNIGRSNINGFSLTLNKELSQHWNTSIGYSYLHISALNESQNINENGQLPESTLNINVGYQANKFNANLSGRGIMNRYGEKLDWAGNPTKMGDYANYWVWDLAANYQFTKDATLFARLNNIFNQFYTDVGSSTSPYDSYWYSAQGRNFEVGLQFQF